MRSDHRSPSAWRGLIAGTVGGLAGAWAHEQAQAWFSRASGDGVDAAQQATGSPHEWDARSQDQLSGQAEPATVRAADAVSRTVRGRPLERRYAEEAGPIVHYAFGAGVGAIYGVLAETHPDLTRGGGIPFGMSVWAGADQVAMTAFGFAQPPDARPPRAQVYSVVAHVAFGAVTEAVRRGVRAAMR
jgi:hypothetical protein